jgi:hypothetical protein
MDPKIYTTEEWHAAAPSRAVTVVGRPKLVVDHHTAGHAPQLDPQPTESLEEAFAYARSLQRYHMQHNGWIDSGHNFLVTRAGYILEGRHGSLRAITAGRMVLSAHAPGANRNPGIEHEHLGAEDLTAAQKQASVALHTFICRRTGIAPTEFYPHSHFNSTECPGAVVVRWLPELKTRVARALGTGRGRGLSAWLDWAQWRLGLGPWRGHPGDPMLRPEPPPSLRSVLERAAR